MSGRLGKAALAANADTDLYTVPAGKVATASVAFCNRTAADVNVRLAVRSGAIADSDYLEYDVAVPANGVLERTQIALSEGETITVHASALGVSARAHGFEESA
jgi:hypothetical protein